MDDYKLGLAVGLIVGFAVLVILLRFMSKDKTIDRRYDERQELVRGKAFKWAFFGMIGYYVVVAILAELLTHLPVESSLLSMAGVILGVGIFATVSIMNDAYIALNENRKTVFVVFSVLGIVNLLIGITYILSGDAITNGCLGLQNVNLLCAALFLEIIGVLLYKKGIDGKEDK